MSLLPINLKNERMKARRILFIDRDGVLIQETPPTLQIDCIEKLTFYPGMLTWLPKIARETDFTLIMVSNQDGLGTDSFPEHTFHPVQDLLLRTLAGEGVRFDEIIIDRTFARDQAPTRKPGTGLVQHLLQDPKFDLAGSIVIGDRLTDMQFAANMGCKGIWMHPGNNKGNEEVTNDQLTRSVILLETTSWETVYKKLVLSDRTVTHTRNTNETSIEVQLNLDGTGQSAIHTGIGFFDHMLDQLARHAGLDLSLTCRGDLHVDEHHTIEDTAIALGEAFYQALGSKRGIERYGFVLPMDDCQARIAIDFGGRSWLVWEAQFMRERIGDMPAEMFMHFFKSFSDAARCNLHIQADGQNEHHKIEAIFKGWAKCIRMAVSRNPNNMILPTTKGVLQ